MPMLPIHTKKIVSFVILFCLLGYKQNATQASTINPVLLAPTAAKFYEAVQQEFAALKQNTPTFGESKNKACLAKAENIERAPKLHAFLQHITEQLIEKTQLKMPTIYVYLGEDVKSYNASMQTVHLISKLTAKTATGTITTEIATNEYNLTIGKELINLFFWDSANRGCLAAVIAHEIGHAVNNHKALSKINEYEADKTAIKILEDPETLPKAIDMLTLAGHIYNNLAAISSDALKEHVHFLIRVMTCSLIKEFPTLGKLGVSSSHTNFAFAVNAALEPILNPKTTGNQPMNAADVVIKAYNKLRLACTSPEQLLGDDPRRLSVQGKLLDELTSKYFSPINHPDPKSRRKHMETCIAEELGKIETEAELD